jgi:ribosomal protein S18 acetylase RimI-like enzyme
VTNGLLAVRHARLDDLDAIVEMRLALLREYGDHPLYGNLRADAHDRAFELFRMQLLTPNETMIVAERDGEIVGLMRCVESPASPLLFPDRFCYVSSVYVRPAARRRGILRALLAAAETWCDDRGITEMRLHSAPSSFQAASAWDALGFEVVEHVRRRSLTPARESTRSAHSHLEAR